MHCWRVVEAGRIARTADHAELGGGPNRASRHAPFHRPVFGQLTHLSPSGKLGLRQEWRYVVAGQHRYTPSAPDCRILVM